MSKKTKLIVAAVLAIAAVLVFILFPPMSSDTQNLGFLVGLVLFFASMSFFFLAIGSGKPVNSTVPHQQETNKPATATKMSYKTMSKIGVFAASVLSAIVVIRILSQPSLYAPLGLSFGEDYGFNMYSNPSDLDWIANRWIGIIILFCWLFLLSVYVLCDVVIFKTKRIRKGNRGKQVSIYIFAGTGVAVLLVSVQLVGLIPASSPDFVGYNTYAKNLAIISISQWVVILWVVFLIMMLFWYVDGLKWVSTLFYYTPPVSQLQNEVAPAKTSAAYSQEEGKVQIDALERGLELQRQRKYTEALPLLKKAVQRDDQSYLAWTSLASVLNNLGKHTEALAAIERALQINPQDASALSVKGFALNEQGYEDAAIEACNEALTIEPNHTYALYTKGMALSYKEELDAALATFERALKINPTYTNALLGKCIVLLGEEKPKEILLIANQVIRIDPGDARAWRFKGMAYNLKHDYPEAINAFNQALQIEPNDGSTWFLKGEAYAYAQEYPEALDALNQALKINPNDKEAQELKARISEMKRQVVTRAVGGFGLRLLIGIVQTIPKVFVMFLRAIFRDFGHP